MLLKLNSQNGYLKKVRNILLKIKEFQTSFSDFWKKDKKSISKAI